MKSMVLVANKTHIAFLPNEQEAEAKKLRKSDSRLRFARVWGVIQCYPSWVEDKIGYGNVISREDVSKLEESCKPESYKRDS